MRVARVPAVRWLVHGEHASAVVPAAGRSSRFGAMKLIAEIDGRPLVSRTIACLVEAGVNDIVVVVPPAVHPGLADLLRHEPVSVVVNPEPDRGMFSSIQAGVASARGGPIVVLPADMPFVTRHTVVAVIDACRATGRTVIAATNGRRGHPIAIPWPWREAVLRADPRGTLKDALLGAGPGAFELSVDDPGVLRDVDVPADLDRPGQLPGGGVR